MLKKYLIAIIVCFYAISCNAQENILFSSYGIDDGLPQSTVLDIIQDKDGFMWASTPDGYARFDGYKFVTYKNDPADTNSINSNRGETFYRDHNGKLWVVTFMGLSLYDPFKDHFRN